MGGHIAEMTIGFEFYWRSVIYEVPRSFKVSCSLIFGVINFNVGVAQHGVAGS